MNEINNEERSIYEVGFHILPTFPEEKLSEAVLKIGDSINKNGGAIISQDFPKMRVLAYDIKKRMEAKYLSFNKAYFGWIKFEAAPDAVGKIEREIASDQNILRFLVIKTVRENTMQVFKAPAFTKDGAREDLTKISKDSHMPAEKTEVSEEEIDKSIDELVIS